jgi:hypothetical protein
MNTLLSKTLSDVKEVREGIFRMDFEVTIPVLVGGGASVQQIKARVMVMKDSNSEPQCEFVNVMEKSLFNRLEALYGEEFLLDYAKRVFELFSRR